MLHNMKRNGAVTNDNHKIKRVKSKMIIEILSAPTKSYSDKKEYRLIKLPNGLTSLLVQHFIEDDDQPQVDEKSQSERKVSETSMSVSSQEGTEGSDEEDGNSDGEDEGTKEKMAAVALCVKVGSFYDPPHIQGLSHFLEHMIFMGSEKYPKENEYDQFITTNGGADNAMTECEYTMFYFEIVEDHLQGAIDRFAQLLIAPLMLRDSMEREMEAVESEFQNSIADDDSRIMQLCASIANGPAGNFTWGNLTTLKEGISSDDLYSAVHDFRSKHYLANRMYLCVESMAPLDELQKLVEANFASVKSGPDPAPLVIPDPIFKPEFCDKVFYVKPKADKSKLYMTFLLPPMDKHYKSKPHDYLAYLIQHEGIGSLSSFLKKKLLALRVEAGAEDQGFEGNSMFMLFSINVTLTEEGFKQIDKVLDAIFSFLLVLKATPIAEHEKAFKELQQIKDTSFKYREEKIPADNVEELAVNMMYYDCKDIITGPDVFFEFDSAIVEDLIERLNQRKFNILILTDKHEKYEKKEKWFGTEYDEIDFPDAFTALWINRNLKPEFSMPPPNQFICTDFDIISKDLEPAGEPLHPSRVFDSNGCECFYKLDARFKLPHAYIAIYLVSPMTMSSVRGSTLTSLYSMIVKHYMTEKLYPAVCAGLGYQLHSEEKGLHLKLSGYNEKLPLLLDIITKDLKKIGELMEKDVFETYRRQYKKYCYNSLINSKILNKDCRLDIVEAHHKSIYDRRDEADHLTFEDLVKFSMDFLKELKIQILVQGNISMETAVEVGKCVVENLKCNEIDKGTSIESRARKIPVGNNVLQVKSALPNDKNSTTTNYIQIGASSIRLQCLIEYIEKIMEEPLFDILRTQETLGYSVSCSHRFNHGILGMSVTVQSQEDKNSTVVVGKRIEEFLGENMLGILERLSDDEFIAIQTALIKLKNMVEVELESEVNRHWSEITSNEYIFNRLSLEAQMIAQITKQDVIEFYKTKVIAPDVRKLSIQVIGSEVSEEGNVDEENVPKLQILSKHKSGQNAITSMSAFINSLEVYPVTKTVIDL